MTVLAAAAEPNVGWGKLVALLVAAGLFWIGATIHQRWMVMRGQPDSPTAGGVPLEGVKPQVTGPSDPILTPSGVVATKVDHDLDEFVRRNVGKMRRADIIRAGKAKFRRSESTIKRAIRRTKDPKP